jgi:hypothetical protein
MVTKRVNKFLNAPTFHQFLRKNQAVTLFRTMLVKARLIKSDDVRLNVMKEIRLQFRQNQCASDPAVIRMLITEAGRSLKQIEALGEESWKPADDTPAELYRVGTNWPWERSGE